MSLKQELRKQILKQRELLSEDNYKQYNESITELFLQSDMYSNADTILIYASINKEVSTYQIINDALAKGKHVYLPKVISAGYMRFYRISSLNSLSKGYMNIPEPDVYEEFNISKNISTIIVCPGVVFDIHHNRIGYGGGFYDRYLSNNSLISIALAYDFQILDCIPVEEHDFPVKYIITPSHIMYSKN